MKRRARIIHARAHSIEPARGYAILQMACVAAGNELTRRETAFFEVCSVKKKVKRKEKKEEIVMCISKIAKCNAKIDRPCNR